MRPSFSERTMLNKDEHIHLSGLKAGQKQSFRFIYDLYHGSVYLYCNRILFSGSLAEEATADVFIRLWEKKHIIDETRSIRPLVFKIARDIAYNYLKKIARDQNLKSAYIEDYFAAYPPTAEGRIISRENIEIINEIIDQLPPKRKEIFMMRYYEEMDYDTIAAHLNISRNTVKVQLVRAKKFLKQQLPEIMLMTFFASIW